MLSRSLSVAALAALFAACTSSTEPVPPAPVSIADGYQLATVNGVVASEIQPMRYQWRAAGDTLDTVTQVFGGVGCVSADGRFSIMRNSGSWYVDRFGTIVTTSAPKVTSGWYFDTRGTWTALPDGTYSFTGTVDLDGRTVEMIGRRDGIYLELTIPAERATYKFAAAGEGSPMRANCQQAGF